MYHFCARSHDKIDIKQLYQHQLFSSIILSNRLRKSDHTLEITIQIDEIYIKGKIYDNGIIKFIVPESNISYLNEIINKLVEILNKNNSKIKINQCYHILYDKLTKKSIGHNLSNDEIIQLFNY